MTLTQVSQEALIREMDADQCLEYWDKMDVEYNGMPKMGYIPKERDNDWYAL